MSMGILRIVTHVMHQFGFENGKEICEAEKMNPINNILSKRKRRDDEAIDAAARAEEIAGRLIAREEKRRMDDNENQDSGY